MAPFVQAVSLFSCCGVWQRNRSPRPFREMALSLFENHCISYQGFAVHSSISKVLKLKSGSHYLSCRFLYGIRHWSILHLEMDSSYWLALSDSANIQYISIFQFQQQEQSRRTTSLLQNTGLDNETSEQQHGNCGSGLDLSDWSVS